MKTKYLAPALAFAALASAQGAQAQQSCVEEADLSDTVTYAVPILYEAMQRPCAADFAANPFMANEAADFVDQFRMRQDDAWPGALRLLKVFMTSEAAGGNGEVDPMMAAVAQLPDESLRPFVDVILAQLVAEELAGDIKPDTCSDIAEAMELLAPLPPENIASLATFIARQAKLDSPAICGLTPTSSTEASAR